jgi:hypothetical protein
LSRLISSSRSASSGDVLKPVGIEVAAILSRSQDRVGFQGGRRHEEDWQEQG